MLTAGALHGVNHALNHAMSLTTSTQNTHLFGMKSVVAVGDLFQLPAVEKYRMKEQVRAMPHVATYRLPITYDVLTSQVYLFSLWSSFRTLLRLGGWRWG